MNSVLKSAAYLAAAGAVFAGGYFMGGKTVVPAAPKAAEAVSAVSVASSGDAAMMDENRVRAIVEAYIKENPSVIMQSVNDYQQFGFMKEVAAKAAPYRSELENTDGVPVVGTPDAAIKIVEFFDYQCPHCKTNYPVLKRLLEDNPDVVLVPKQLPILGDGSEEDMSRFAAKAALAAHQQGKFAELHDELMASPVRLTKEAVFAMAESIGLDVSRLRTDMESPVVAQELERSWAIAESSGFLQTGTPGYLIGGEVRIGSGEDAYERMSEMIEKARAQASGR